MQKRSPVQKTVMEIQDLICDRCGKSCVQRRFENGDINSETAEFSATWGYGSHNDGVIWEAQVCADCAALIYDFINQGDGPGVFTREYARSEYDRETLAQNVEHLAQKHAGMSAHEFLERMKKGDSFEDIPQEELRHVYYPARALLSPVHD